MKITSRIGLKLLLILMLGSQILFAQNTGKISGKVVDKSNNETLIGVPIVIEGTSYQTVTDLDGRFSFDKVIEGTYSISFRYVGFQSKMISGIKVTAGKVLTLDVVLEATSQNLQEVTVTADLKRESIGAILLMQKKSATVQDGISSEAIKKTADRNTGEVIKRISGASIQEGKFVVIRGLNDRYNSALLNGMPLASTEPDRKAFAFDIFPSSMIDNLIVVKTASPDLPGEFAGGILQINTRDIPEQRFFSFTAGTGLNSQSTFKSYTTYNGGKEDWLGIDDGTRALPENYPSADEFKKLNTAGKINASKLLNNDWATKTNNSSPLNQNYQLAIGEVRKVFNRDLGIIAALNYNAVRRKTDVERADYDFDGRKNYTYTDEQFRNNVFLSGMLNASYKLNDNNKLSIKNILSINSDDVVISRTGTNFENMQYVEANALSYTSTRFINSIISGEHFLPEKKIRLKWYSSYTNTGQKVPDTRRMYYYRNIEPGNEDTTLYAYVPFGTASPNYAGKFYGDLNENNYNGEINASLPLFGDHQTIKFGYYEQYKSREFTARALGYVVTNPAQFNYNLLTKPVSELFTPENMSTRGFRIDEITNPSDHYTASANTHAGYFLLDNNYKKFRFVYGLRVENFIQKLNSFGYSNDTVRVNKNYLDLLPSLNITYSLNEKTNLRFAASKTVARPEFRELAPFGFYDFSTATSVQGNAKLKRTEIYNFDLRTEVYPSAGQVISASLFYKQFLNPIEPVVESSGAGSRLISFQNSPKAYVYGIEVELRKNLGFMANIADWSQWENFTLFGNGALMNSQIDKSNDLRGNVNRPLQGQSPYVVNGGLGYSNGKNGLGINLVYNRIGRRIFQVGNLTYLDIYEAPRDLIDVQISKRIFEKGEIRLNINDIFNQNQVFYQDQNSNKKFDEKDSPIAVSTLGRNISLSFTYRF